MFDVVIIGGGPAGVNAAIETSENNLKTLLIDEQPSAGGQVWREKSKSILNAPKTDASINGDALRTKLNASNVEIKFDTRVWHIEKDEDDNWLLGLQGNDAYQVRCKKLIIATGAQERVIPVPGWTLPGVFGLAGATALFKEHMMVPARRTIVAGNGPLLFYVASEVIRLGGHVSAVISLNSKADWLRAMPTMLSNPALIFQGIKWLLGLYKNRVPIYWQYAVKSIEGKNNVEGVTVCKVDNDWLQNTDEEQYIHGEGVCYGHGLMPAIEATRLAGAEHHFDPTLGGWVPTIDQYGRTTVSDLYACGDNAGILGVNAAPIRGRLAAKAIFEDLNIDHSDEISLKELIKAEKFGLAATALTIPRPGLESFITADTEVCRCEGVTRNDIDLEIKDGGKSPNAIKSSTRCAMGPCGGRFCAESLAMITEARTGKTRTQIGLPTTRSPLRPVAIDDLADELDYNDLKVPGVSPL